MTIITIERLEQAINVCRTVQPPVDYVLGPDLRKFAIIWGEMIAARKKEIDLDTLPPAQLQVVQRWLGAAAHKQSGGTEASVRADQTVVSCSVDDCEFCQ